MLKKLWTVIVVLFLFNSTSSAAEKLTYIDLVNQLTDLERLAVLPPPGQKCAQFSSYDRSSRYDEKSGKYLNWGANGDGRGIIRQEKGKQVLAEMSGPGVIWRIWSAKPEQGHVRIYLEGSDQPAVDLPFAGYFDRRNEPFTYPALVNETASGQNNYIPIPYQNSCKIVADEGWGLYYHYTYTTYPKGTVLPTFKRNLTAEEKAALVKANNFLANCGTDPAGKRSGEVIEEKVHTAKPGQTSTVVKLDGQRAITAIKVKVDLPGSGQDKDILRDLILRISWDGEVSPSVFTPLGNFFGTTPGVNKYKSLPLGMTDDGFYCYWYMPFAKSALVELGNQIDAQRKVAFTITHAPLKRPISEMGRFHACWHRDADLPPDPERRAIDWTMLKTQGHGRYVGVQLHIWNLKEGWWGEGDEKFYIDGEKFPSTFGTGSEDYFGYAWGDPVLFQNCYHNQTVCTDNIGHISLNRWHISDNVPFQKSFEGAIEKYYSNNRPTFYDCVAYWYQTEAHRPWTVGKEHAGKIAKQLKLYEFIERAKGYSGVGAIEPLRKTYKELLDDAELAYRRDKITLAMSRIEKAAGNNERHNTLIQPLIDKLVKPFVDRDLAADFSEVLPKTATEQSQEKVLLVSEIVSEKGADGSVKRIIKDGRWCIVSDCDVGRPYIYFALPENSRFRNIDLTVNMRITYYYSGDNLPYVQYDSFYSDDIEGFYRDSKQIAKPAANGWHTAVVPCPRARLDGHQNARSDFRIVGPEDKEIYIADVRIE